MKLFKKSNLILCGIFLLALILLVILVYQFIILAGKKQELASLKERQTELAIEIENAEATLEIVSSKEYQESEARKNGYSYPNEKRWFGIT